MNMLPRLCSLFLVCGLLAVPGVQAARDEVSKPSKTEQTSPRLRLEAYSFDPLKASPDIPKALILQEPGANVDHWRIIQFKRPLDRKQQLRLKKTYGLSLSRYLPDYAYIEKISLSTLEKLQKESGFRASIPYHPAFRISSKIGKTKFRTKARKEKSGFWLRAILFRDAELSTVAERIKTIGATEVETVDETQYGGVARVRFLVPTEALIQNVAKIPGVRWIEEIGEIIEDNGNTSGTMQSGTPGTIPIWNQNLQGEGQIVAVVDSGPIDINHCMFQDTTDNTPGPAHRKVIEVRGGGGASTHATFVAGILAGDDFNNPGTGANRGNAFAARIVSSNSFGDFLTTLSLNRDSGATIHTNSWHENTEGAGNPASYTQYAADTDTFMWNNEDHLVLGSMGNNGEEQGPPGTAKNAIGVNASQVDPNEGTFGDGNPGPTSDGRRKPDLAAPGCAITSAQNGTACTITTAQVIYGRPNPICATSWATPAASAAATLVRQYYMDGFYPSGTEQPHHAFTPSGALIKATLLNGTINMANIAGYPSANEGWGMIRLNNVLFFPGSARNLRSWDFRNATGVATGETRDFPLEITTNGQPLRVTLAWTEPPAAGGAADDATIINDLDLQVIEPDGTTIYRGNQFTGGVSNTNAATDAVNNLEQVLVNNPNPGTWTLRVTGTAVNVGNPWQGFALVASADTAEPPVPTGTQNTLVVRTRFPDADLVGIDPPLPNIQNTMDEVVDYFDTTTYSQVDVQPDYYPDIVDLDHNSSLYFPPQSNPLIELSEEVMEKLLAADPAVFDRDGANPDDDIERIIIVTNDPDFNGDWATTGTWPYDVSGLSRPLSVSLQSYENSTARFTHGLLHQMGLIDLYAHEGVVFDFPHATGWDNMAKPFANQHALVWNKDRPGWVSDHGSTIEWIPRPAAGGSYGGLNPIPIFTQDDTGTNRKAIMIGLTESVAAANNESVFYMVEARDTGSDTYDAALPESGVLIYYVNENVAQGEGPVWLLDADPGTPTLADAAFQVGESRSIPGTGITIEIQAGTGGADYNIDLTYDPPDVDNDVNIVKGQTIDGQFKSYMSPDIWVDNQRNGFDEDGGGAPNPNNADQPVEGEINRLYFRLHNPGPADAYDVNVHVRMSEPYHTVGGSADFNRFVGQRLFSQINTGTDPIGFVEWIPDEDDNPHSCAWVETLEVFNDSNTFNNEAQENLREVTSSTSSPYEPVNYTVAFTNPYDQAHLFYFRAEGIPDDWSKTFVPEKALLAPGQKVNVQLQVQPPDDAPVCSNHNIDITSWVSRGDTLVQVGGGSTQVGLRGGTRIKAETGVVACDRYRKQREGNDPVAGPDVATMAANPVQAYLAALDPVASLSQLTPSQQKNCAIVTHKGCTDPIRAFEEIIVRYEDPAGNPVYHSVMTDANGCYEDFYVAAEGGTWTASAEYPGNDCDGPAVAEPVEVNVGIASDGDQDDDGRPDKDEYPTDTDGDGLVGPMDPDSDNDGLPDGEEQDGDADGDGFVNVIDPDSDNDGILDGQDPTPYGEGSQAEEGEQCTTLCSPLMRLVVIFIILFAILVFIMLWRALRNR